MSEQVDEETVRRMATMWASIVQLQAERFFEAVADFNKALHDQFMLDQQAAGELSQEWQEYMKDELASGGLADPVIARVAADQYFFLSAAAQLRKCVQRLADDGLPKMAEHKMLRLLRDVVEHWEQATGRSVTELRETIPDVQPGRLWYTKHDIWIEGVSVNEIVAWAAEVDQAIRDRNEQNPAEPTAVGNES